MASRRDGRLLMLVIPGTIVSAHNRCGHGVDREQRLSYLRRAPALRCREPIGVGAGGWATQKNIYRCRTAADWFVLRSEQTSNSHIFWR